MALYKEAPSDYGFMVSYWNIGDIRINKKYRFCDVTMYGYVNQEARLSDQAYAKEKDITLAEDYFAEVCDAEHLDLEGNNIYKSIYNYVKSNDDFFQDAEDILEGEV